MWRGSPLFLFFLGLRPQFIGGLAIRYSWVVRYVGGGVILIFGLHLLGIINIKAFQFEKKVPC